MDNDDLLKNVLSDGSMHKIMASAMVEYLDIRMRAEPGTPAARWSVNGLVDAALDAMRDFVTRRTASAEQIMKDS